MYLRLLQAAGIARAAPWSVRPLAPAELGRLVPAGALHPWAARLPDDSVRARRAVHVQLLAPGAQVVYNSGFRCRSTTVSCGQGAG
jgi:hypothetical protein